MFSKDPANLDALKTSQSHQPRNLSSKPGSKTSGVKVAGARKNQRGANGGEENDVEQVELKGARWAGSLGPAGAPLTVPAQRQVPWRLKA